MHMEKRIKITRKNRHGEARLFLEFVYDTELTDMVKTIPGACFSSSQKTWHIADERRAVQKLLEVFRGKAWIDYSALHSDMPALVKAKQMPVKQQLDLLSADDMKTLSSFGEWMEHKRYSPSTIKIR